MNRKTLPGCIALVFMVSAAYGQKGDWEHEVLLESEHGMSGLAAGDLDPASPGNEVVAVNDAGEVWMVRRSGSRWEGRRIHKGDGELIMCAIGDVDPRHEGNEFVGVGMVSGPESTQGPGQVLMLRRDGDRWEAESIFQAGHGIHGVAVGDVSARHPGNEVIACGFDHQANLVYLDGDRWRSETIYVANDRLKIAAVADVLPGHEGMEVLICGSDGRVVVLWEGRLGWCHDTLFSDPAGQSRIDCREGLVLSGGDAGKLTLISPETCGWESEFVARDTDRIRGTVIADLDNEHPGFEVYACGYSGRILQMVRDNRGFWHSAVIFTDERALHHLVACDIDPGQTGEELITCGHGGRLIALWPKNRVATP